MRTLIVPRVDVDADDELRADERGEPSADSSPPKAERIDDAAAIEVHPRGNGVIEESTAAASERRLEQVLGW